MSDIEEDARRSWELMRKNAERSFMLEAKRMSNRQILKFLNDGGSHFDISFVRNHRDVCEYMVVDICVNKMFPES
jgi:hypothetical protein